MDSEIENKAEELAPLPPRTLSALPKKGQRSAGSVSARSQDSGHMSGKGDSDDEAPNKDGRMQGNTDRKIACKIQ